MKICTQLLVITLFIAGAVATVNALDVMKLKRMLNVTMQRKNPTEKPAQEKNTQLKKMLERDKSAEIRIETRVGTPILEQKKLEAQSGEKQKITTDLVIALKSVEDIIEKQLDKAVYFAPELYLPKEYHKAAKEPKVAKVAIEAITADISPIISAIGYLQNCYKLYQANTVFNTLLKILYYTKTKEASDASVLQIIFYHPEKISTLNSDKRFTVELSDRIIKALIEIKKLDKNFKPAANKDSNQFEIDLIERLNLKKPQQEWTDKDF